MGYINTSLGVINLLVYSSSHDLVNLTIGLLCLTLGLTQLYRERS